MTLTIPQIGKYEIRRELGKGAMGVVYEGYDPILERFVAIKTILPAQLVKGEAVDVMARFRREAQAAGRLNHTGIVAVYDYGEVDTLPGASGASGLSGSAGESVPPGQTIAFIAMELVVGQQLRDHFDANECFTLDEVGRLMCDILAALTHSHGHGVIHRDIKPANLILLNDGRVKISDFGIARTETSELTRAGTVLGTPAYMSPEQLMGLRIDARSDLFSCGVVLYQFLTGEKPFDGNPATIMFKVMRDQPPPPSSKNSSLPAAWDKVVERAIAKMPEDRFQSAEEFAQAVREAMTHPATSTRLADPFAAVEPPANPTAPNHERDKTIIDRHRLRTYVLMGLAGVTAALLASALLLYLIVRR